MSTKEIEEMLEDKSPVMRGSEVHDRTFNIKAVREDCGIRGEIKSVQVEERFAPMHYDLHCSTDENKDLPYKGKRRTREKAFEVAESVPEATVVPDSSVAIVFETIDGDKYHFKFSVGHGVGMKPGDLCYELMVNNDPWEITEESPVPAVYEPSSNHSGELRIQTSKGEVNSSRRVYDGEPSDKYSESPELLEWHSAWISYKYNICPNSDGFVECPVVNAYENKDGEKLALVVENPIGKPTVFEFEVTPSESAPYWELIDSIASGDPANLADSDNSVYLRHRYLSFYEFGPYENRKIVDERHNDVISIDVKKEWELRLTSPKLVSFSTSDSESLVYKLKSLIIG